MQLGPSSLQLHHVAVGDAAFYGVMGFVDARLELSTTRVQVVPLVEFLCARHVYIYIYVFLCVCVCVCVCTV